MNVGGREGEGRMVIYRLLDGLKIQMSKACIDRSDSLIFEHKRRPRVTKYKKIYLGFTYASSEVHFRSTESQTFYQSGPQPDLDI